MRKSLIAVPFWFVSMIFYVIFRMDNNLAMVSIFQPLSTFFIVIAALLSFTRQTQAEKYSIIISIGLCFSLGADIFAIDTSNQTVLLITLGLFVIVLLIYAIAIITTSGINKKILIIAPPMFLFILVMIILMWKGDENMRVPVIIYAMLWGTLSTLALNSFFTGTYSLTRSILLSAGVITFMSADLMLGLFMFFKPIDFFRNPFFYTTGQMLIALSCSYQKTDKAAAT